MTLEDKIAQARSLLDELDSKNSEISGSIPSLYTRNQEVLDTVRTSVDGYESTLVSALNSEAAEVLTNTAKCAGLDGLMEGFDPGDLLSMKGDILGKLDAGVFLDAIIEKLTAMRDSLVTQWESSGLSSALSDANTLAESLTNDALVALDSMKGFINDGLDVVKNIVTLASLPRCKELAGSAKNMMRTRNPSFAAAEDAISEASVEGVVDDSELVQKAKDKMAKAKNLDTRAQDLQNTFTNLGL